MKLYHARFLQPTLAGGHVVKEDDFYVQDVSAVRRLLVSKGLRPIEIRELKPSLIEWMDVRSREWQLQLLRALRFQTATASAGTALLNIIEGETDPRRRLAFLPTHTVLKGGGSFSEALRELKLMDAATMAIITAGERAGDLKGVIQHAVEHVEQKGSQYKAVMAALSWLSFDIVSIVSTNWGLQYGFIPYLEASGTKSTDSLAAEKLAQGIKWVKLANGSIMILTSILLFGGTALFLLYWFNRHKPDHFTAKLMMRTPLVSGYLKNIGLKDTCKLMSRLLRGKVPLADAIKIIKQSTVEPATKLYWMGCEAGIMAGLDPSRALSRAPLGKAERDQIVTVQSVDQLADVYESIADERHLMAKTDQRKIVKLGIFLFMFITGVTILAFIYLLMLQNQGFLNTLNEFKGG